jgi:hypothetical protein
MWDSATMAVVLLVFMATRLSAFDLPDSAGWPEWWGNSIDPSVRIQGSEYLRNPQTRAVGDLMLARHYESSGQLAKALHHAGSAMEDSSDSPLAKALAAYVVASNLGSMGRLADQKTPIEKYAALEKTATSSGVGLQSSGMMEFYRLSASGNITAAKAKLDSLGDPKDTDSLIETGFAKANLAAMEHRDPSLAYAELEKILPQLSGGKKRGMVRLYAAGAVYSERLFQTEEARSLLMECLKQQRSQTDYILPETDLARLCISSGQWSDAVEWLEKAHNAKMTLRPNYRQEAIKHLALATADFYLATGHPDRALASLEKIQDDFLRPGYTTERLEYFLAGYHLRVFLASDLQLRLLGAAWFGAGVPEKLRFAPGLAALAWQRTSARMQFRQNLSARLSKAPPGVDIAQLYFGPAWLLPAMRHAVGDATFQKICTERTPEGRRLEILAPLLVGGGSKPIHADTPQLLRATILAQRQFPDIVFAYQSIPSSLLLSLRPLPVADTNMNFRPAGWMARAPDGFQIDASDGTVSVSAADRLLRSTARPEAKNTGALLEKLSKALLAADFPVTEQTAKKIEGGAVAFAERR